MNTPHALWRAAPRQAVIDVADMGPGPIRIRARRSLISRGTERLVFEGRVPKSEWARMRAPWQEGVFDGAVKYGYASVGTVEDGPEDLLGRDVFALFPHQTLYALPREALHVLPPGLPPARAALAANMETALNALWDAGAGPGDRIAVIGGGLIGCLVARLASRLPGSHVTLVDVLAQRANVAAQLNVNFTLGADIPRDCDIAFHCSASAAGLAAAVDCLGDEGRLVELSWYGDQPVSAPLGGAFHARRLQIISSQVGHVSPSRRPRWPHARRLAKAIDLLDDPALDALLTEEVAFEDAAKQLSRILAPGAPGLATVITYE